MLDMDYGIIVSEKTAMECRGIVEVIKL